ncbi:MAG: hypothetical protein Q3976_02710 [Corynebacterium sp.]|nr:hypothetical protein [Corynebacterium sp.]
MRKINRFISVAMSAVLLMSPLAHAEPALKSRESQSAAEAVESAKVRAADKAKAVSLSQEYLSKASYVGDIEWDKASIQSYSEGKAWVLVPVNTGSDKVIKFHRIAVDLDQGEAVNVQTYEISDLGCTAATNQICGG